LEAESETAAARAIAAVPSPALAVPPSLYASLMARLDRLGGPGKGLGQIAGGNCREFSPSFPASGGGPPAGAFEMGVGAARGGGFAVPTGRAPACDLSVQACPGAGRGLRDAVARAATHTTCAHRRNH